MEDDLTVDEYKRFYSHRINNETDDEYRHRLYMVYWNKHAGSNEREAVKQLIKEKFNG